ncbi:hypothetical protein LOTGIDRAFT_174241 [Lottia gigantea]|uniref:Uncharacterized protein n=1 Tax=Lottia gigantea TaxID=225164 RepID=V4AU63_LOTGI|nr:hypothetical protein LOTGIDRAFT_174241 [Lottia gigantea]ESO98475.1 hypothetical protein LOTGIDRAFT_174241 [Lottia gigantea]
MQLHKDTTYICSELRDEISVWRFLDSVTNYIPWKPDFQLSTIKLATDSSNFRWGAVLKGQGTQSNFGDYWDEFDLLSPIHVKEAKADTEIDEVFNQKYASSVRILAYKGDGHVLLYPSKTGFRADKHGLTWNLLVVRFDKFDKKPERFGCSLVPNHVTMLVVLDEDLRDGLHLNKMGNLKMMENINILCISASIGLLVRSC